MILPVQPLPAVIPAKAGISRRLDEIPAFAGMTENAGMTASAGYDLARDLSPPPGATPSPPPGATPSPHPSGGRVREGGRTLPPQRRRKALPTPPARNLSPPPSGVREGGRTLPAPLPVLPAPLAAR